MKKTVIIWMYVLALAFGCLLAGCGTTPGKVIATASSSVDHAMQAWAVYVVNGHAAPEQEAAVRAAHRDYLAAEDLALEAYVTFSVTGDRALWAQARDFLRAQERALIQLIDTFQGGSP